MNHMRSVMDTVMCLRGGNPFCYSDDNNNMYRIVSKEADGSSTAYYFSTPIYRRMDCKPVELRFALVNGNPVFHGSDARISYDGESLFDLYLFSAKYNLKVLRYIAPFSRK